MPVRVIFKLKDAEGNAYYTDADGNPIDKPEEDEYVGCFRTQEYEDYINSLTEEDLQRQREEGEARWRAQQAEKEKRQAPFTFRKIGAMAKPVARFPLWASGDGKTVYWAERELCILAGDAGVGKSLMAIKVARSINNYQFRINNDVVQNEEIDNTSANRNVPVQSSPLSATADVPPASEAQGSTHPLPLTTACQGTPPLQVESLKSNRVLYIDWELTEEDFVRRFGAMGEEGLPDSFLWAGRNMELEMPDNVKDKTQWLLQNFATTVRNAGCDVVIVDQPDRLHLSPQKWDAFLYLLKDLMRELGLSVMLVLSNKSRHINRSCGLNNVPKGNIVIPPADSIVMMAQNQRHAEGRYIKVLKNRNRPQAEDMETVDVLSVTEEEGFLGIACFGKEPERHMLPPNAAERKNRQIMQAERLWDEGMCYFEIAERMELPESTVKRWLKEIDAYDPTPYPSPEREGRNPSPSRSEGTPTDATVSTISLMEGDISDDENLLQQQGFERRQVRVSMPK